jgi:hypothetical protein
MHAFHFSSPDNLALVSDIVVAWRGVRIRSCRRCVIYDCGTLVIFQSVFRIRSLTILFELAIFGVNTFEFWIRKQYSNSLRALKLDDWILG